MNFQQVLLSPGQADDLARFVAFFLGDRASPCRARRPRGRIEEPATTTAAGVESPEAVADQRGRPPTARTLEAASFVGGRGFGHAIPASR
jgi:hypothetical protein